MVSRGTSNASQVQIFMLHSHSITRQEGIIVSCFEAAVVEGLQATNLVVGNESNSKPSRFHDQSLLQSIKHPRGTLADIFWVPSDWVLRQAHGDARLKKCPQAGYRLPKIPLQNREGTSVCHRPVRNQTPPPRRQQEKSRELIGWYDKHMAIQSGKGYGQPRGPPGGGCLNQNSQFHVHSLASLLR